MLAGTFYKIRGDPVTKDILQSVFEIGETVAVEFKQEGDVFRITVPLSDDYQEDTTQAVQDTTQVDIEVFQRSNSEDDRLRRMVYYGQKLSGYVIMRDIVSLIMREPELSQKQVAERLNLNINTTKYYIRKLKENGIIERAGSSQKGKWIVKERKDQ